MVEIRLKNGRLDQFSSEELVVNSSISKIQDISSLSTDKSRSIILPATPNNNRLFKYWYNSDIVNGFDSRIRVDTVIENNGELYSFGKIRLTKCKIKKGRPYSYTVDYVGALIYLKEIFGDDELTDLDFSAYDFDYTSANVISKLTSITLQDITFTLTCSKKIIYDSAQDDTAENVVNAHYNNNSSDSGIPWTTLYPSIRNQVLFNVIANHYELDVVGDITNNTSFNDLYMVLNRTESILFYQDIDLISTEDTTGNVDLVNNTFTVGAAYPEGALIDEFRAFVFSDNPNAESTLYIYKDGEEFVTYTGTGSYNVGRYEEEGVYTFAIESDESFDYRFEISRWYREDLYDAQEVMYTHGAERNISEDNTYIVSDNVPDMTVYDYFGGLIKWFKLIVIPQEDGTVYIDTITNYYKTGNLYSGFEKYIDNSEYTFETLTPIKKINYNFQEPSTILATQFYDTNDYYYGDLEVYFEDDNGDEIDGDEQDVELPFETVLYESVTDIAEADNVNLCVATITDEDLEPTTTEPIMHYIRFVSSSIPIKLLDETNTGVSVSPVINMPSYNTSIYSSIFNQEYDPYTTFKIENTIYTNYYKSYVDNMVAKNARVLVCSAKNLPPNIINRIKLNDVLEINHRYYRINEMDVNLSKRDIDFQLLLDNEVDLNYVAPLTFDRTDVTFDSTVITFDRT